jgi:hypothetical protein
MSRLFQILFVLTILVFSSGAFSQTTAEMPNDLTFEKPLGWFEADNNLRTSNLKKYGFSKSSLAKLSANDRSSGVVAVFYRDDPKKTQGIIPTIQVILRPKAATVSFDQFKKAIANPAIFASLEEFALAEDVKTIEVSSVKSVLMNATFRLRMGDELFQIKTRTYAIPREYYFIQISMSDENDAGWTEKEFSDFISTIQIVN